jgi:phosphatidylglycerophosphate synthase
MMDEQAMKRLRAAVGAAWWTVLIFAIYLTIAWFAVLYVLHARPDWMLALWGGEPLTWGQMQITILWCFAVLKLVWWVGVMITVWLTLYARRLARQN